MAARAAGKRPGRVPLCAQAPGGEPGWAGEPCDRCLVIQADESGLRALWQIRRRKAFEMCTRCKHTAHCSREYQGAAWPVHKRTGKEMKAARKKEQQAGSTKATPKEGAAESQKPTSAMHVDATAVGSVCVFVSYGEAPCMMIFTSRCDQQVPPQMVFKLSDVDSGVGPVPNELDLLLSCGTIPSLTRVKRLLDDISRMVEQHGDPFLRNIQQLRLPGAGCTPLERAARKGNFEIAEFLCKHPVTAATVKIGAPVACRVGLLHGPGGARQDAGLLRC